MAVGSHSGLVRLLGEQVGLKDPREFKSRPHRHIMKDGGSGKAVCLKEHRGFESPPSPPDYQV